MSVDVKKIYTRLLASNDAKQVENLDAHSGFWLGQWVAEGEANTDYAFGIFDDDKLIGYCSVGGADDVSRGISRDIDYNIESLLLSDVYVLPEYRKNGIALKMLTDVMSMRVNSETIYCEPSYLSLINLYDKVGFEKADEEGYVLKRVA